MKQKFLIDSTITIISTLFFKILAIFFNSYISQKLGKEILGIFNIIMSVYFFGINIANFGLNFTSTKIISEEIAIGNKNGVFEFTKKCIFTSIISGLSASFIFLAFSDFIIQNCFHNKVNKLVIYIICLALPFISISSSISRIFYCYKKSI